jgi:hypothetical protein
MLPSASPTTGHDSGASSKHCPAAIPERGCKSPAFLHYSSRVVFLSSADGTARLKDRGQGLGQDHLLTLSGGENHLVDLMMA